MDYINIAENNLELKHIITGPAPVGRILNYVILAGKGILKHKHGSRDLKLKDSIGSAWCTEFLVGLGLAYYDNNSRNEVLKMYLTKNGQRLFNEIKDFKGLFDEKETLIVKNQLDSFNNKAISIFETIFRESVVFKNLEIYVKNNGATQMAKNNMFLDNYFETFLRYYENKEYNRGARTPTGRNRVPSLLQLCDFFGYTTTQGDYIIFDLKRKSITDDYSTYIDYSNDLVNLEKNEEEQIKIINNIEEKYGIDGNVLREAIVRNSKVQSIFRHNLFVEFEGKCAITGKYTPQILMASHIKQSSISNVYEKINHNNGLLLSANYDRLFDNHLISFEFHSGKILINKSLIESLENYSLDPNFILDKKFLTQERKDFLIVHNMEFYAKNKE